MSDLVFTTPELYHVLTWKNFLCFDIKISKIVAYQKGIGKTFKIAKIYRFYKKELGAIDDKE